MDTSYAWLWYQLYRKNIKDYFFIFRRFFQTQKHVFSIFYSLICFIYLFHFFLSFAIFFLLICCIYLYFYWFNLFLSFAYLAILSFIYLSISIFIFFLQYRRQVLKSKTINLFFIFFFQYFFYFGTKWQTD